MWSNIRYDELISNFFVHEIHVVDLCDRLPSMGLFKLLSFRTIDIENLCLLRPIFSKHHFLRYGRFRSWRDLSMLPIVSTLEKDGICQDAEKQHLQHREEHELQAYLCRSLKVRKRKLLSHGGGRKE